MNTVVVCYILLALPVLVFGQTNGANNSVTSASWFWPVIILSFGIALSIPILVITVILFCMTNDDTNASDESDINSDSSASPSCEQNLSRPGPSYYVVGFPSPPPPYALDENSLSISLQPPPYTSTPQSVNSAIPPTVINIESPELTVAHSTEINLSHISPNLSVEVTAL